MIETVIIDNSFIDYEDLETRLRDSGYKVEAFGANGINADRCIYIINGIEKGMAPHIEFILSAKDVRQWIIIALCDKLPNKNSENVYKRDFRNSLNNLQAIIEITDREKIVDKMEELLSIANKKTANEVLIVSRAKAVGKKSIAEMLKKYDNSIKTIIGGEKEYTEHVQSARLIVIVGCDISDFLFAPPDDGYLRVVFVLNKIDEYPVRLMPQNDIINTIISELNKLGWRLHSGHRNFYITSALYEQYHHRLSKKEISVEELALNENFYIWDDYGLPLPTSLYNDDTIKEFFDKQDFTKCLQITKNKGECFYDISRIKENNT